MNHALKKTMLVVGAAIAVAAIAVGALAYRTYRLASSEDSSVEIPAFSTMPSDRIKLGDDIKITTEFTCPWGHRPKKATLSLAEGLQVVAEPTITKASTKWGRAVWSVSAEIQPYRTGKIKQSECSLDIVNEKNGRKVSKTIKTTVPGFDVLAVDTGKSKSLDLAGRAKTLSTMEKHHWLWWAIVTGLAVVALASLAGALLVWRAARRRLAEQPPPAWVVAIAQLENLKRRIEEKETDGQTCVAELTDIIRNYLEERFRVKTTSRTTHEFLIGMERGDSPLETEHRLFLRDFMTAADLVKFAKLPVDDAVLNDALAKARRLVESTIPQQDETEKSGDEAKKEMDDV